MTRFFIVLLVVFAAHVSQPARAYTAGSIVQGQLALAAESYTASEVIAALRGATISRTVTWVGSATYVGAAIAAGALIYAAVDWYYSQGRLTYTSLDDWYAGVVIMAELSQVVSAGATPDYYCVWYAMDTVSIGGGGSMCDPSWTTPDTAYNAMRAYVDGKLAGAGVVPEQWVSADGPCVLVSGQPSGVGCAYQMVSRDTPLADWLESHPDAANAVITDVVPSYVAEGPIDTNNPAEPYPGLILDPVPVNDGTTADQWPLDDVVTDDPTDTTTDPTTDELPDSLPGVALPDLPDVIGWAELLAAPVVGYVTETIELARTRVPFAYIVPPSVPTMTGSTSCSIPSATIRVSVASVQIAPCEWPVIDWWVSSVRPLLVWLVWLGLGWTVGREVLAV